LSSIRRQISRGYKTWNDQKKEKNNEFLTWQETTHKRKNNEVLAWQQTTHKRKNNEVLAWQQTTESLFTVGL
jgi:hypothetical protein